MAEASDVAAEAARLEEFLGREEIHPLIIERTLQEFSDASKNELVARLARTFNPPPLGRLLSRLLYIRTPENEPNMMTLFLTNLRSPNQDARAASLLGLNALNHPNIFEFALSALRDDHDLVLFAACNVLLPKAKDDPNLSKILQDVYAAHAGDPSFHMSMSLLEAHSIV